MRKRGPWTRKMKTPSLPTEPPKPKRPGESLLSEPQGPDLYDGSTETWGAPRLLNWAVWSEQPSLPGCWLRVQGQGTGWGQVSFVPFLPRQLLGLGQRCPSGLWSKLACGKTPAQGHLSCLPISRQGWGSGWAWPAPPGRGN